MVNAKSFLAPFLILLGFFVVWQYLVIHLAIPEYILPKPTIILKTIWQDRDLLWPHLLITLKEVLLGFGLAFVVSMIFALLIAHVEIARRSLYPLLVASQTIPIIAVAPLFLIWFGYGIMPKVIVTALISFFPLTVNTVAGYWSVDPDLRTLFHSYHASRWQTFRKLSIPAALPNMMAGIKISVTLSVIGATIGEWVGSDKGLGYMIIQAQSQIQTPRLFAALALLSITGIGLFILTHFLEWLVMPWRRRT